MTDSEFGVVGSIAGAVVGSVLTYFLSRKDNADKKIALDKLKTENVTLTKELGDIKATLPKNFDIIKDVTDVLNSNILPIISDASRARKRITVKNLGLDLHSVMPWLEDRIVRAQEFDSTYVNIQSLIIDPGSELNKNHVDGRSNISAYAVEASIKIAKNFTEHETLDRFNLEIRQYGLPPIIHGFLINDEHLFIGFTEITAGKYIGGTKPYLHLWKDHQNSTELNAHYFKMFENWFDYYWQASKQVANVGKK